VHTSVKAKSAHRLLPGLAVKDGYTRHPFDLEHGVKTSGLIAGRHLETGHTHDRYNTAYYGVAPSVFHALIRCWKRSLPILPPLVSMEEFTFIDFGAGMGRALLLAAEMPFREVVGVELHPGLVRIAKKNLTLWKAADRARAPVRIVLGSAVEFVFPPTPCVAFLFNPFGAPVLRRLVDSMAKAFAERPGQLDLIYVNDEHAGVLEKHPGLRRLFRGPIQRSRADAVADHSILANQPEGEYASSNYEDCSLHRWVGMMSAGDGVGKV